MGIKNLSKLIKAEAKDSIKEIHFNNIHMCKIAIDTSIILYQYVIAIRSRGSDLTTSDGRITSHIHGIVNKALGLVEKGVLPVFIFDGKPPELKKSKLDDRRKLRNDAEEALKDIDDDEKRIKLLKKSVVVTSKQMNECKDILKSMGIPVIDAPEEADSQAASLAKRKMVYGVASEDMDLLTFGTPFLLRNFSLSKKKKIMRYDLKKILEGFEMDMNQFIDLCILLGCDYLPTIGGIGPMRAFKFIKKYKSIEGLLSYIEENDLKKFKIPKDYDYLSARKYFQDCVNCKVKKKELKWKEPNYSELTKLLLSFDFSEKKINVYKKKLEKSFKLYKKRKQKITEQKAGKKMLAKMYNVKEKTESNDSFKVSVLKHAEV